MITAAPPPNPAIVVGLGRLGSALARALEDEGGRIERLPGRAAADNPGLVAGALARCGTGALLLLAVRDEEVGTLAERVAAALPRPASGRAALHLSGALGLDVLAPLALRGLPPGSCHPLQTFPGSSSDASRFRGAAFAVDGDGAALGEAERLARTLGGRPFSISRERRALYHLAASLSANGLTALVGVARDALVASGLDAPAALGALAPLLRAALEEALGRGPEDALTGPVARGDEATIARHRRALLAWDARRAALLEALLREQRGLAAGRAPGPGC